MKCNNGDIVQVGGAIARMGEVVTAAAGGFGLPGILAMPFIAAASYYLLVVNAPTPVVKVQGVQCTRVQ